MRTWFDATVRRQAMSMARLLCLGMAAVIASAGFAVGVADAQQPPTDEIALEVFTRPDDEPCRRAVEYAREFARTRGGIRVEVRNLLDDLPGRERFWQLAKRFGIKQPGLPAFYVYDQLKIGFTDAQTTGPAIESLFQIRAFVRSGCPHCRDAKRFLTTIEQRWPAVRIDYHDLDADPAARHEMGQLAARYGQAATGLPVIELFGHLLVGYQSDSTSGREIEKLLERAGPKPAVESRSSSALPGSVFPSAPFHLALWPAAMAIGYWHDGDVPRETGSSDEIASDEIPMLPPPVAEQPLDSSQSAPRLASEPSAAPKGVEVSGLGYFRLEDYGLFMFTIVIGLIDGFNPCAMWVLIFVLSVLINVKSRARILLIAGTFVVVSGLAYFAFMTAWLNLFLLIGWVRPIQITLGLLAVTIGAVNIKDFVAFKRGFSFSIPESAKPGIYSRVRQLVTTKYLTAALATATVLAITVNMVELLCTAGLPAVYIQILTEQHLPTWANYSYTALYVAAYMFDDSLMLAVAVATLSMSRMQETQGRWLKLLSGVVLATLGAVMVFAPQWLQWAGDSV